MKSIHMHTKITELTRRNKDIEFIIGNRRVTQDQDWLDFVTEMKAELIKNTEIIGHLQAQLKLLKLETV